MASYQTSFVSTPDGEMFTTNSERELNARCSLGGTQNTATTSYWGFIDLSDTVNWPHDDTGRIDISYVSLLVDKAATARGTTSLGLITRIDGASADIAYIASASFVQNDSSSIEIIANFAPSQLKCDVVAGTTPHIKTNNIVTGLTAINTSTPLAFGAGGATFTPAVGDLILRVVTTTAGDLTWGVSCFYHSHP